MSVAIVTTYHGPTNSRGSRITASVPARVAECRRHYHDAACQIDPQPHVELYRVGHWTLTIGYDDSLSSENAHRVAAQALADRLDWNGKLVGGALDNGYAFTFADTVVLEPEPVAR